MSYQDHFKTCPYCNKGLASAKPAIRVKSASSCEKRKKLADLAAIITGRSYGIIPLPTTETNAASVVCEDKKAKLRELGKMIRSY
jgi:hypothetical protein